MTTLASPACRSTAVAVSFVVLSGLIANAVAQVSPAPPPATDPTITLTPFEVVVNKGDGYEATNTNSITGTNVSLAKVPVTADIYNRQLMEDLGYTDISLMLSEFSGLGIAAPGADGTARGSLAGDGGNIGIAKVRGISGGAGKRDGLVRATSGFLESFGTERVELIRGPQSLIYGSSDTGGLTNLVTKSAQLGGHFGSLRLNQDENGTYRAEADFNVSVDKRFAVRAIGLREERRYWRDNLEKEVRGEFVALAFRPSPRLTFRAVLQQFERFDIQTGPHYAYSVSAPLSDARSGQPLSVLLAQGRAGDLINGKLNWKNVDSIKGDWLARLHDVRYLSLSADTRLTKAISAQVRVARDDWKNFPRADDADTGLRRPNDPTNPTGKWAFGFRAATQEQRQEQKAVRASITADFKLTRFTKNQFIAGGEAKRAIDELWQRRYYLADANGNILVNQALINDANAGRTLSPVQWQSVEDNLDGNLSYRANLREIVINGRRYIGARQKVEGAVPATEANPRGMNGGAGGTWLNTRETGWFGTFFTDWFDGKFDTMIGARADRFWREVRSTGQLIGPIHAVSKNVGAVWHVLPWAGVYYGYSDAFKVNTATSLSFFNEGLPPGRGRGHETGIKIDLPDSRLSGALAFFKGRAENESDVLVTAARDVVDPAGINGRHGGPNILFDRETRGMEISVTARPVPRLNLRASLSFVDGQDGNDVALPIYYNDQFNTTTVGGQPVVGVSGAGGIAPLMVRQTPGNTATPLIPLSLAMMRDATSPYFARLDPASGRITNASALGLLGAGVGTDVGGQPISSHQLGFVPPSGSTFLVRRGGDVSTGYPARVFTLAASWRFGSDGILRGVGVGANVSYQSQWRSYYYNDGAGGARRLYQAPDTALVGAWVGYQRKFFKRYTWSARVNVANAFDSTKVLLVPRVADGGPSAGRFNVSPREIQWSNTISF